MKIIMVIIVTSFLGLTACSDNTNPSENNSSNLFGNLDIACESESCL